MPGGLGDGDSGGHTHERGLAIVFHEMFPRGHRQPATSFGAGVSGRRRHSSSLCLSFLRETGTAVARLRRPRRRQPSPHPAHVSPSPRRPRSLSHRSRRSREAPPPLPKRLLRESPRHQARMSRGPRTGEQNKTEIRNRLTSLIQEVAGPTPEARTASVPVASFLQAAARLTGFIAASPTSRPATVSLRPHRGLTPASNPPLRSAHWCIPL